MLTKLNAYKKCVVFLVMLNAPFLLLEQIHFLCVHAGIPPNECYDTDNMVNLFDFNHEPGLPCHDDEEAEMLSLSYARDEEEEEKPHRRKKPDEDDERA